MRSEMNVSDAGLPLLVSALVVLYGFAGVWAMRKRRTRGDPRYRSLLDTGDVNIALVAFFLIYAIFQAIRGAGLHLSGQISTEDRNLLLFALLCGLLSYGTIEILRRLFRIRGWLQLWETERWLAEQRANLEAGSPDADWPPTFVEILTRYLRRQNRTELRRLFDLQTEQLAAQISTAVDIAIEEASAGAPALAVSQLSREVRAGVDGLQIALRDTWRRAVQGAAVWIAGAYGLGLSRAGAAAALRTPRQAIYSGEPRFVLVALIVGGPLAWFTRDLVSLIGRADR